MEDTNLKKALEEFEATLGRKIPSYQDPEFDQFIQELRQQEHPMAEVIHMVSLEHAISEGYKPTEEEVASLQQQRSKAYLDERSIELATPPLTQRIANWFTVERNGKRVPHRGKLAALVVGGGGIALAALLTPPAPPTQTAKKPTPPVTSTQEVQPTELQPQLETAPTTEDPALAGVSGAPADDGTVDASTLVAESPQQGYETPIQDPSLSAPTDGTYSSPGYTEEVQPTYQEPAPVTPPPAPEVQYPPADAPSLPVMAPSGSQPKQPQVVAPRPPAVVYRAQPSNETLPSAVVYPAKQNKESAGGQQGNTQKPQLKIYQGQALPKPEKVSNIYGRQNNTPALQGQGGQQNSQQKAPLAQTQQSGQQNQASNLSQGQQKQNTPPSLKVYQAAPKQQSLQQNVQGSQQTGQQPSLQQNTQGSQQSTQKLSMQQGSNTQGGQNKAFAVYNRQGNPGGGFSNASGNAQQGGQNTGGQQGNTGYQQSYGGGQPNVTNTSKSLFVVYKNGTSSKTNTGQNTGSQESALKKIYDRNAGGLQGNANPSAGNPQGSGNTTGGGQAAAPYTAGTQLTGTLITRVVTASGVKVPVIAKTNDGAVWVGSAGIDATKRITINFERVVIGGQEIKAKAVAFSSLGEPSLQASVSTTTPNLLPEVLRSSVGGVSNYVDALLNQKTVTLNGNGSVTQSGQVPSLGLMVGANVADLFKIEQNRATIIDIATVEKDTPIIIVTGVSSDGADGATKFD